MNKKTLIKKKIPAFTLMEVTVSMLIAAIAITITYTAAHIISVTYGDYQKKQEHVAAFLMLDKLLKQDFTRDGKVIKTDDGLQVETTSGFIRYEIAEGYVVRDQFALSTDTFKLDPKNIICTFEKQVVTAGQNMDQIELQTTLEKEEITLVYQKIYSSQDLIH